VGSSAVALNWLGIPWRPPLLFVLSWRVLHSQCAHLVRKRERLLQPSQPLRWRGCEGGFEGPFLGRAKVGAPIWIIGRRRLLRHGAFSRWLRGVRRRQSVRRALRGRPAAFRTSEIRIAVRVLSDVRSRTYAVDHNLGTGARIVQQDGEIWPRFGVRRPQSPLLYATCVECAYESGSCGYRTPKWLPITAAAGSRRAQGRGGSFSGPAGRGC
jgi:hypothetical protein